jgi:hypothetical protein
VASAGVVAVGPAEDREAGFALVGEGVGAWRVSRLNAALSDSAAALSAEWPTALMDWIAPALR